MVVTGALLLLLGASVVGLVLAAQRQAPQPSAAQAGSLGPTSRQVGRSTARRTATGRGSATGAASGAGGASDAGGIAPAPTGLVLAPSPPVSIAIPALGVAAPVNRVGLNPNGTVQVPPFNDGAVTSEPAWYTRSPTPGQPGASVILGHIDTARYGPADFFSLGALQPGDEVDVTLADGKVAVFTVDGVRSYPKSSFPDQTVFGPVPFAGLRLITCGGSFDSATRQYVRNIVVFASLSSAHPAG